MFKRVIFFLKKYGLVGFLEYTFGFIRGKGYGSSSIKAEIDSVSKFLIPDAVKLCIDVGGNIGDYSDGLRKKFPNAVVYTFEPSRTNINKLEIR